MVFTDYAVDKNGNIFKPAPLFKYRCYVLTNRETGEKIGVFKLSEIMDFLYGDRDRDKTVIYDCAKRRQPRIRPTDRIPFSTIVDYGTDKDMELAELFGFYLFNEKYGQYLTDDLRNAEPIPKGKKKCSGPCGEVKELKHFASRGKAAKCKCCHNAIYNRPHLTIDDIAKGAYIWP